jgi:hypothetical protein
MLTDGQRHCLQLLLPIILLVQYHSSICHWPYLLCQAILKLHESPWKKLYLKADDTSFLHMTGLILEGFRSLLWYLFDLEDITHHCCRERPCFLRPDGYLGLLLFYLGNTIYAKHLCLILEIISFACGQVIWLMLNKVVKLLQDHPFAWFKFSDEAKMRQFADMVQLQEPTISDIIGFMDCVLFPVEYTD